MWGAIEAVIWTACLVAIALLINRQVQQYLQNQRYQLEALNKAKEVELLERQNQAAIDAQNIDELARLRRAELTKQAAEAEAAEKVAQATLDDRIQAEREVLAARTATRISLAKEAPLEPTMTSEMAGLFRAYEIYRNTGGTGTFEYWLGDIDIQDGRISY